MCELRATNTTGTSGWSTTEHTTTDEPFGPPANWEAMFTLAEAEKRILDLERRCSKLEKQLTECSRTIEIKVH